MNHIRAKLTRRGEAGMFDQRNEGALLKLRRRLFGYACALCPDIASAEDLYQEAMLRALSARSIPDDHTALRVWMFRIIRNLWIDNLRAKGRLPEFDDEADIEDIPASNGDDLVVNALAVRQAFGTLPKKHRDVLALVDICGFSYAEVSELLDVPQGTIMSRISRARSALAARMHEDTTIVALPMQRPSRLNRGQ